MEKAAEILRGILLESGTLQTTLSDGSGVLVDLKSNQFVSLNQTAVFLLNELRSNPTHVADLAEKLSLAFDVDENAAQEDVRIFIANLVRRLNGRERFETRGIAEVQRTPDFKEEVQSRQEKA